MKNQKCLYLTIFLIYAFFTISTFAQDSNEITIAAPKATPISDTNNTFLERRRLETFNIVWQTINDNYFDQTFSGLDWNKIKLEYEPQVKKLETDEELHKLLQKMISRLRRSHFSIIPPEVFMASEKAKEKSAIQSKDLTKEKSDGELLDSGEESTEDVPEDDIYSKYGR